MPAEAGGVTPPAGIPPNIGHAARTSAILLLCGGAVSIGVNLINRAMNTYVSDQNLSTLLLSLGALAGVIILYIAVRPRLRSHGAVAALLHQPATVYLWASVVLLLLSAEALIEVQALRTGNAVVHTEQVIIANQAIIQKNQELDRRIIAQLSTSAGLLRASTDPQGAYRQSVDSSLCAILLDVRAVAIKQGVNLFTQLTPPGSTGYAEIGPQCKVAVVEPLYIIAK
jgi:hypothetical protein